MNTTSTTLIIFFSWVFFSTSAVWGLHWASKRGQLQNLEKGARSIFTEEEPEGKVIDRFPPKSK